MSLDDSAKQYIFSPKADTLYWVSNFARFHFAKHMSLSHGSSGQSMCDFLISPDTRCWSWTSSTTDLWTQTWTLALISHHLASSMAPFSSLMSFSLVLLDRGRCLLRWQWSRWRSRGRTVKYNSRATGSHLKQNYQAKQLRMRLTAANVRVAYRG